MGNERITENLVRSMLQDVGYYDDKNIIVEEQSSRNVKVDKLLKHASKSGVGKGRPEFIITDRHNSDDIIVIECKANTTQHESDTKQNYKDYAVDGVLLYASFLKKEFNVTAIAVSGETDKEKKVSTYIWLKNAYQPKYIQNKTLLNSIQLRAAITEQKEPVKEEELIEKAIEYNELLHKYSIPEVERCTVISSILVALQDNTFLSSYKTHKTNSRLMEDIIIACKKVLEDKELSEDKVKIIIAEYSKYKNNKQLTSSEIRDKKTKQNKHNTILRDLINDINDNILPYIKSNKFDVLGKFYTQFIRYAGSDKKTGLVLTPSHITDFFCDLVNITKDDVVLDPCCGTGGFLVSAMNRMLEEVKYNDDEQQKIKLNQLIGIEIREDMFSHACSNMMMREDGKSSIYFGDCFDKVILDKIKKENLGIRLSFLNPPYQDGNTAEQLEFIENSLDCLVKGGECVAICQMATALNTKGLLVKERIFKKHTLKAVFSMPDDLFHPIGVVTVILVFKAHTPHDSNIKSFFGYFKDDGFEKKKHKGRVDRENKWEGIKGQWLNAYKNNESIAGLSVTKEVTYKDEWVAEAYMETDYSILTADDFIKTVKNYAAFQFLNEK